MKLAYIFMSGLVVILIRYYEPWKSSYKPEEDTFLHVKYAILPCAVLALIINADHTSPMEILWTFSIYLEAVAIFPQCVVMRRYREIENLTANYVFSLGVYRALYIVNWIYRIMYEEYYHAHWIPWIAGVVQTLLYVDFFYYYIQSKYGGKSGKGVLIPEAI